MKHVTVGFECWCRKQISTWDETCMDFTGGGSQGRLGGPLEHDANLDLSERKRERMMRESVLDCYWGQG